MKAPILMTVIILGTVVLAAAQESESSPTHLQIEKKLKGAEQLALPAKPELSRKSKKINWGGFFSDFRKLWKPAKDLSKLDEPKAKKASDNVYRDPASGQARGFVLFAIRF